MEFGSALVLRFAEQRSSNRGPGVPDAYAASGANRCTVNVTSATPTRKRELIARHCTASSSCSGYQPLNSLSTTLPPGGLLLNRAARLWHEPVAHGGLSQKVFRLRRVVLELATQVTHVHTDVVLLRYI